MLHTVITKSSVFNLCDVFSCVYSMTKYWIFSCIITNQSSFWHHPVLICFKISYMLLWSVSYLILARVHFIIILLILGYRRWRRSRDNEIWRRNTKWLTAGGVLLMSEELIALSSRLADREVCVHVCVVFMYVCVCVCASVCVCVNPYHSVHLSPCQWYSNKKWSHHK